MASSCFGGDLDSTFAYYTKANVAIRDKRLGLLNWFLMVAIFLYVIIYQIVLLQQYAKEGGVLGTVRLSLLEPELQYRAVEPPYCSGATNSSDPAYAFPAPGLYTYTNPDGVTSEGPQGACVYLDAVYSNGFGSPDASALLMPTRITVSQQSITPLPACQNVGYPTCAWNTTSQFIEYVPDASMFTLMVDHSMTSSLGGTLSRNSRQLSGKLVDSNGNQLDPCLAYYQKGYSCPSYVKIGQIGAADIFPLQSLLTAAGISNLDSGGGDGGGLANETIRLSGIVILVQLSYTNYFLSSYVGGSLLLGTSSFNSSFVEYFYRVSVIPNAEFKAVTFLVPGQTIPSATRTTYDMHGMRIVIDQIGRIGFFDIQTFMINLVVGLGLLAVSSAIVDNLAVYVCPQRMLYRRLLTRHTVSMGEALRGLTKEQSEQINKRLRDDAFAIDPVPPFLQDLVLHKQQQAEQQQQQQQGSESGDTKAGSSSADGVPLDREISGKSGHGPSSSFWSGVLNALALRRRNSSASSAPSSSAPSSNLNSRAWMQVPSDDQVQQLHAQQERLLSAPGS